MRFFFICAVVFISIGMVTIFFYPYKKTIEVIRNTEITDVAKEREEECDNKERRAIAVMIAEDVEARPLSGIGLADIVIEMPVVTGSITRMMAIFICKDPVEIGSVRSARHDFIPLALGFDAILAHWGGSHFALDDLDKGIIDNLDAMPNYFEAFYRKPGIQAPHDGFTSMKRMLDAAEKLGYRLTTQFEGYSLTENHSSVSAKDKAQLITIGYAYPYNVRYEYNPETNTYLRWRGEFQEIDAFYGEQIKTKNIVVMRAPSRQIGGGYNDVDILGGGEATVYRNGEEIRGTWTKKEAADMLRFYYDESGEEIKFAPGTIWINVVEPSTIINYE